MNEHDVREFARRNGLPEAYVAPFYATLRKTAASTEHGVGFEVFNRYVSAREQALRKVFDTLDTGVCQLICQNSRQHSTYSSSCIVLQVQCWF